MGRLNSFKPLRSGDFLSMAELSRDELQRLLATAIMIKRDYWPLHDHFTGRSMVMLFEKPSLRTRLSFEIGFARLGGHPVYLDQQAVRIGERESASDVAKNLERLADVIVARTFSHDTIEQLACAARVPVINALSDRFHPCQAMADMLTIAEHFPNREWRDLSLAYIGDGNNVCHSLMLASAILGMRMTIVTPEGYAPAADVMQSTEQLAAESGASITITHDVQAIKNHNVVYTDTWVSMGSEAEAADRLKRFKPYQVTPAVMKLAGPDAVFMHCLPAYRDKEVAAEVIDGPQSIVFDQAENRMHAQNALLLHLLSNEAPQTAVASVWPDLIGAGAED